MLRAPESCKSAACRWLGRLRTYTTLGKIIEGAAHQFRQLNHHAHVKRSSGQAVDCPDDGKRAVLAGQLPGYGLGPAAVGVTADGVADRGPERLG
jgi:hypothetical protein